MKIVIASTVEQVEKIKELIEEMYRDVFPMYFSDEKILDFQSLKVLNMTDDHFERFGTLKEAFQVIASLQTIVSILRVQTSWPLSHHYEAIFNRNVQTIQNFGLFFPFTFKEFSNRYHSFDKLSMFAKVDNELLI